MTNSIVDDHIDRFCLYGSLSELFVQRSTGKNILANVSVLLQFCQSMDR